MRVCVLQPRVSLLFSSLLSSRTFFIIFLLDFEYVLSLSLLLDFQRSAELGKKGERSEPLGFPTPLAELRDFARSDGWLLMGA